MAEIKKGDRVELKSGGPIMTVEDVGDFSGSLGAKDGVKCVWFDAKNNNPMEKVFDRAVLKLYTEDDD